MTQTVQDGLVQLSRDLTAGGVADAPREARILMAHALGVDVGRITLLARDPLAAENLDRALAMAKLRIGGAPISHVIGHRQFYGRRFEVSPAVLDPRPETETLIAAALAVPFATVLDLGTGSGCIVATLLAERQDATGTGVDVSPQAIAVAGRNGQQLGVSDRLTLVVSDWFATINGRFDLIVSNPPYIAADEMPALDRTVRDFEPRIALTDEADGLTAYRQITAAAGDYLVPAGWLMVEIGPTQGAAVVAMMQAAGFAQVAVQADLDGRDRVVLGQKPPNAG